MVDNNSQPFANTLVPYTLTQPYYNQQTVPASRNMNEIPSEGSDNNLSPRSLEHLNQISHGISQLVDDIVSPDQDSKQLEAKMKTLNVCNTSQFQEEGASLFDKGFGREAKTSYSAQQINEAAGATPIPSYTLAYQEGFQQNVTGVPEFQQQCSSKPKGSGLSRYSGEFRPQNKSQDGERANSTLSDLAVGGLSANPLGGEDYSMHSIFEQSSDYHDQLEKYGYIFQSPDIGFIPRQLPLQHQFQHQLSGMAPPTYHQSVKHGYQHRASSFDKVAQQPTDQFAGLTHPYPGNEDVETHSAASSGNQSAFSEGDLYNYNYQTPHHHHMAQGNYMYGQSHSNKAAYGFTPTIQFTGSNQKQYQQQYYIDNQQQYFYQEDVDELTPTNQLLHQDIQISGADVQLQGHFGTSPRRNNSGDFKQSHLLRHSQVPQQEGDQYHQQFKTPSPYRNSDGLYYSASNPASSTQARMMRPPQQSDPFYPNTQLMNQRLQKPLPGQIPFYNQRLAPGQVYSGSQIGMLAPPMTREIGFQPHHNEQEMLAIHQMHSGPMIAKQQHPHPQHPGYKHNPPQPLRTQNMMLKQTNSQERDANYMIPNLAQANVAQFSKTVDNTPTHDHDTRSMSSNNSNLSNQFSGLIMDQNETILYQVIKQFDECPNHNQRLDLLRGNVHKLALTQTGSRFLQKQLTKANSSIVSFFLEEIGEHLPKLMVDNYGNYFCQKLLSSCSGDQRLSILKMIRGSFIEICCNKKGTHTIQTMFDLVNLPEEEDFIKASLIGSVVVLALDAQGTHVVQKVIASFEEFKRDFIFEEVYEHFIELAMNTNGLCVVKKLVQNTTNTENAKKLLLKIAENVIELVQNPFGNYAVTEVINNWDFEVCKPIFVNLKNRICQLSIQKFSSNVIERCLEKTDQKIRTAYIEEITNSDKLSGLIRNSYGNYVVQKALKIAFGKDKQNLIAAIQKSIPQIPDRKIRTKWEQIIAEAQSSTGASTQPHHFENLAGSENEMEGGNYRQVTLGKRANSSDGIN